MNLGGKAPTGRQVKHIGNHTSGRRRAAAALRRPDGGAMSKRRRHDVAVTSITADMEDVVLTSANEYRSFIDSAFVELHSGDWAYIVFDGKIFILAGIFSFFTQFSWSFAPSARSHRFGVFTDAWGSLP